MNKILILSYYFPPLGLGGVQRISKLCKYLKRVNWEPIVITVKDICYYEKDYTLLSDIQNVKVHRTGSLDPLRVFNLFKKSNLRYSKGVDNYRNIYKMIESYLCIPDSKKLWIPFAYQKAAKIIEQENINIVLTSSPPNSIHLTGLLLKKMKNIKWISDFRDLWMGGDFYTPPMIYKSLNKSLERMVVCNSDFVTGVSSEIIEKYKDFTKNNELEKIYNGFDIEDFPDSLQYKNDRISLAFYGSIHKYSEPSYFINRLIEIIKDNEKLNNKVELKIIGRDYLKNWQGKISTNFPIINFGYLEHKNSILELIKSDLVLFFISDKASGGLITGRIFEIIASGKPVLAIIPDTEIKEVITKFKNVHIFHHNEKEKIKIFLKDFFDRKLSDFNISKQWENDRIAEEYSREKSAKQFAEIFEYLKRK